MKKKTIALLMAVVMLFGAAVGGTLAWLMDSTDEVVNTFTVGNIDIELDEFDADGSQNTVTTGGRDKANKYKLIPGEKYLKDAKVYVRDGSEACWLFVQVNESNNDISVNGATEKLIKYTFNGTGWTAGTGIGDNGNGVPVGVYFREVEDLTAETNTEDKIFTLLTAETVNDVTSDIEINANLTKEILDAKDENGNSTFVAPTLTFTAYAVQKENVADAATAWGLIPESNK